MQTILLELLRGLEAVADRHEEIYDSEVREQIGVAVMDGFVRAIPGYSVPTELGVLIPAVNSAVHDLLVRYIDTANVLAAQAGLARFHDRLAAFQDPSVRTARGKDYDDFFGHTPPEYYGDNGDVQWYRVRKHLYVAISQVAPTLIGERSCSFLLKELDPSTRYDLFFVECCSVFPPSVLLRGVS